MIVVVEQYNAHKYSRLMDEMFRLRARIFHDRLKWDVRVTDGKERDKYDDEAPVYIIYTDEQQREVKGSLRLLPTTGPTLLADCFADTIPDAVHLSSPTIWEGTRFCLSETILDKESQDGLLFASIVMITGLGEIAVKAGIEFGHRKFRCRNASTLPTRRMRARNSRQYLEIRSSSLPGTFPYFGGAVAQMEAESRTTTQS